MIKFSTKLGYVRLPLITVNKVSVEQRSTELIFWRLQTIPD